MARKWTGYKKLKPEWVDGYPVRKVVRSEIEGSVLVFPSGKSQIDGVHADIDESLDVDVVASLEDNPFSKNSFDTVYCDPPYGMYWNDQTWIDDLWGVASKKLILQTPMVRIQLSNAQKKYLLIEPTPGSSQRYVKTLQIFTRENHNLT